MFFLFVFFFFQAEDGIRDDLVTGVQTCALPISTAPRLPPREHSPGGIQDVVDAGRVRLLGDGSVPRRPVRVWNREGTRHRRTPPVTSEPRQTAVRDVSDVCMTTFKYAKSDAPARQDLRDGITE